MLSLTHTGLHHNCQKKSHIIYSSSFYFSFKSSALNMDLNSIVKDAYRNNCLGNQRIMREIFNPFPMHREKKKKFSTDLVIFSNFACIAHLFQVFFFFPPWPPQYTTFLLDQGRNISRLNKKATNERSAWKAEDRYIY